VFIVATGCLGVRLPVSVRDGLVYGFRFGVLGFFWDSFGIHVFFLQFLGHFWQFRFEVNRSSDNLRNLKNYQNKSFKSLQIKK
jgi:hypothetical protein